ncbi:MAG: hypothetical protein BMS9Abin36_1307 [Gammaproteobacteria bacterium]|nr:MAG: hypothetical protein BMS9Abin36_1307 [Gammaproteobacteria bacterium]
MPNSPIIRDVMTSYPYFIDINAYVNSAKVMLTQYKLRHLPVKQDNEIVALIGLRDIEKAELHGVDTSIGTNTTVKDICVAAPLLVEPDTPLKEVLEKMAEKHIECVLVASDHHLEGIMTTTDICRQYANLLD